MKSSHWLLLTLILGHLGLPCLAQHEEETPEYLIIVPHKFKEELNDFIYWRSDEFELSVVAIEEIAPQKKLTASQLKAFLSSYYQRRPYLNYVLLIGSCQMIPSWQEERIYDFPYSLLSANDDLFPDVYLGRIPVENVQELGEFLQGIMEYEHLFSASDHQVTLSFLAPAHPRFEIFLRDNRIGAILVPGKDNQNRWQALWFQSLLLALCRNFPDQERVTPQRLAEVMLQGKIHAQRQGEGSWKQGELYEYLSGYSVIGDPALKVWRSRPQLVVIFPGVNLSFR